MSKPDQVPEKKPEVQQKKVSAAAPSAPTPTPVVTAGPVSLPAEATEIPKVNG